jgi:hypothetical protein
MSVRKGVGVLLIAAAGLITFSVGIIGRGLEHVWPSYELGVVSCGCAIAGLLLTKVD